jgi:cation diffusion facilitator CzcD-associated flavoprotein CzcO
MAATPATTDMHYDAVVIGAGFGGIRMLYELGKRGFSARAIEAGSGVGGTWYWNRCEHEHDKPAAQLLCCSDISIPHVSLRAWTYTDRR